jgi:hypothetical protein
MMPAHQWNFLAASVASMRRSSRTSRTPTQVRCGVAVICGPGRAVAVADAPTFPILHEATVEKETNFASKTNADVTVTTLVEGIENRKDRVHARPEQTLTTRHVRLLRPEGGQTTNHL